MTAGLNLLVALWFFVSPWVYGAYHMTSAWTWIIGAVLAIVAAICGGIKNDGIEKRVQHLATQNVGQPDVSPRVAREVHAGYTVITTLPTCWLDSRY